MKKILFYLLCVVMCATLAVPVTAHEVHDHIDDASVVSSSTLPLDLDQDQDGIPDYMDNIIDIDGDGIGDAGPTYQQPPKESMFKKNEQFPWGIAIGAALFVAIIAATVILKILSKKKKEE